MRATINNYEIEYSELGKEYPQTLVFAHGLGGNMHQWNEQLIFFSKKYHVITFSLQGHGDSSKTENMSNYTIKAFADTALKLLDYLYVDKCIWIGNSMGGVVGYEVMSRKPYLITKLITNGTTPELIYDKSTLKIIYHMDRLMIKLLGFEKYISIAVNATLKDATKRQQLKTLFMAAHPYTIIQSHQLLGNYSYLDMINATETSICIIMTPNDKDINKSINKYLSQLETNAHVELINYPKGGHVFNIESPDAYNHLLQDLL